jgi:hypothetical protein
MYIPESHNRFSHSAVTDYLIKDGIKKQKKNETLQFHG